MHRTQIYLTDAQRRRIAERAEDAGVAQAVIVRQILDRGLGLDDGADDRVAAVDATAGILQDAPDWPEWLAAVRGSGADERLTSLGQT